MMQRFMIAVVGLFLTVLLSHAEPTVIKITDAFFLTEMDVGCS